MTDILDRYPHFRGKPQAMAMFCALLRQRGSHADALALGAAALEAAPDSSGVATLVTGTLSAGLDTFHLSMLQDEERNRAYARAIEAVVRPGMRVLEIGTGAGLLAMIAARAGAEVVTCEANPMIAAAASEIVRDNGLADRISVVAKPSNMLRIPEDLPGPADLVIHEIFGAALFDEGVTAALRDARARLLKPGAPSVPPRASVRCALVREVHDNRRRALANVEGFDLSLFELLVGRWHPNRSFWRNGAELASEPYSVLAMDYDAPAPFGRKQETITVPSFGGRIDGIAQWIAIDFGDDRPLLQNSPFDNGLHSSWGARYTRLPSALNSMPGDRFDLNWRHRGKSLQMDLTRPPE